MKPPNKQQILKRRKEIEQELSGLLKETESDLSFDDIMEIIYNEDGQDSLSNIITVFDRGQDLDELNDILKTVNDAWNYFPHKILGGLSPAEKLLEYRQGKKKDK